MRLPRRSLLPLLPGTHAARVGVWVRAGGVVTGSVRVVVMGLIAPRRGVVGGVRRRKGGGWLRGRHRSGGGMLVVLLVEGRRG